MVQKIKGLTPKYIHHNPWSVAVELVEGCNRLCDFCGLNTLWKNKEDRILKFMDMEVFEKITKEIGHWLIKKRIEFCCHGESILHPNVLDMISMMRELAPKVQMQLTTNGIFLRKNGLSFLKKLYSSGLNILLVDTYDHRNELISMGKEAEIEVPGLKFSNFYAGEDPTNPWGYVSPDFKSYVIMDDVSTKQGKGKRKLTRVWMNHAGNVNWKVVGPKYGIYPLLYPLQKKCSRPFRELVIHWDGSIPACCLDFSHDLILGKFPEDGSLEQIWHSDIFNFVRFLLFNKWRYMTPCFRCDYKGGFRLMSLKAPTYNLKKEQAIKILKNHYNKYRKYAHKNADPQLFAPVQNVKEII